MLGKDPSHPPAFSVDFQLWGQILMSPGWPTPCVAETDLQLQNFLPEPQGWGVKRGPRREPVSRVGAHSPAASRLPQPQLTPQLRARDPGAGAGPRRSISRVAAAGVGCEGKPGLGGHAPVTPAGILKVILGYTFSLG